MNAVTTPLATPKVRMLGVSVSRLSLEDALKACLEYVENPSGTGPRKGQASHVCFANCHSLVESVHSPKLAALMNQAFQIHPDGMPLVWLSRLKGEPVAERVCGPDFTPRALTHPQVTRHLHGFIGGPPGQAEGIVKKFGLRAVCYSPPYRPFSEAAAKEDWEEFLRRCPGGEIPTWIWVGLGAPKQELWTGTVAKLVQANVLFFAVGAAFDFLSDTKSRAPRWMQKTGLEWTFRLAQEPRRLMRRYAVTNSLFCWYAMREWVGWKYGE